MKKLWNVYVREQMAQKNITQDELAERLGRTQGGVGHWLTGRRIPNFDDVAKILNAIGVENVTLSSDGMLVDGDELEYIGKPREGMVAVIGEATMGKEDRIYLEEIRTGYINIFSSDPNAYCLRVRGSSMEPRIHSGEFVLIEPKAQVCNGDDVLVRTIADEYMIKVFEYMRDGEYRFSSINQDHDPFNLQESEVEYVHAVSAIIKSSRFVALEDLEP